LVVKKLREVMLFWRKTPVPGIKTCTGNCPGLRKSVRKHYCQSVLELPLAARENAGDI